MKLPVSPFAAAVSCATLLSLTACGSNPPAITPPSGSAATEIFVPQLPVNANFAPPQIYIFPVSASGRPAPSSSILLPASLQAEAVATDPAGNIYVATSSDLREYAAGANGNATPLRIIPDNATTTLVANQSVALAADASGNLYVGQPGGTIAVFGGTANGSVAPSRILSGAQTTLGTPVNLAADAAGSVYALNVTGTGTVAANEDVVVFAPGANGNIAPARVLNTGTVYGLALDSAGNLYTASVVSSPQTGVAPEIAIYAAGASGNAAPARTIAGQATTLDQWPHAISVDGAGNIYVVGDGNLLDALVSANPTVWTFPAGSYGNVAPTTTFVSPEWTGPQSIAVN